MAASWTDSQVLNQLDSGFTWSGATITYSFPASSSGMYAQQGEDVAFRAANAATQAQVRIAIQTWDDLIAPNFAQGTPGTSNIEVGFTTSGIGYAHAYFPDIGSMWLNGSYTSGNNDLDGAPLGTHGFSTYIHELGHALGLNHMGNYNGSGAWSPSSYQDSTVLSVMSYFGPTAPNHSNEVAQADWIDAQGNPVAPQTPMLNDIMAIQAMYGASTTTRTDNTTYGFNSTVGGTVAPIYDFNVNRSPVITLWDSGGTDTLDLSGWSGNSIISLLQGSFSSGNAMTNNICIAWGCVIENAVGGAGSDALTGNGANNGLQGNGGSDNLFGGAGDDTLFGGAGSDVLDGGTGTDTGIFGGSFASYTITYNAVTSTYSVAGGDGTDTVTNIEFFQFADQTRSAAELLSSDTSGPTLSGATPADNAANVSPGANIVLSFSEAVLPGTGSIVIHNANGSVFRTIAVTDASQVTISGATVTINPSVNLAAGAGYYVTIDAGAIKDQAGNAFAGIASSSTLNFSTAASADTTAPTLTGTSPSDNAVGVAVSANLTLTFSETVQSGSGSIEIHNANGSLLRAISVNDASQVSFSGSTVTINPSSDFALASGYYVTVASGAIVDAAGNAYAGISSSSAFNFTTAASSLVDDFPITSLTTGLVATNGTPSTGVINFVDDGDWFRITLQAGVEYTFDMTSLGLPDPWLILRNASGGYITDDDDGGNGLESHFTYTPTSSGTYYLEAWDAGSGTGAYRITVSGGGSGGDDYPWSTSTSGVVTINGGATTGRIDFADDLDLLRVELVAGQSYIFDLASTGLDDPFLTLYDPDLDLVAEDDDGADVPLDSRIEYTATRSGTFYLGAMDYGTGTGTYTVRAIANTDDYPYDTGTQGRVTVGGAVVNGNVDYAGDADLLKITLTAGVTYVIELERTAGGLTDPYLRLYDADIELAAYDDDSGGNYNSRITYTATASGTYYIAVSDYDDGTGGYTVEADVLDVAAPTLQSTTPSDGASGVAVGANLTFTFNEAVRAGSGNIVIYNSTGTVARSIPVTDASQVTFSGSTMTVNPASDLSFASGYYVNLAPGVVLDAAGNAHAGITGSTAFNFSTASPGRSDDFPLSTSTSGVVTVDGAARSGGIDYAFDGDLFRVTLVAGNTYRFDLARAGSNGLDDPYLQLFGNDQELRAFDDDSGGGLNSRIVYTATASGTYYLAAYDYDEGVGSYGVSAATVPLLRGTANGDSLQGSTAPEVLRGLEGADTLRGGGGNDHIEGGQGVDTAVFVNPHTSYVITPDYAATVVRALSGSDGTDTLIDVERLQFTDRKLAMDLDGNAGIVARTLGAVFGPDAVDNAAYAGIGLSLVDEGMSAATLMQLALDVRLGGGASPQAVVNLLYTNVIGVAPDAATRDSFVSLITSGAFTPGTLGVMAAETPYNDANIDIVGLARTGLVYA